MNNKVVISILFLVFVSCAKQGNEDYKVIKTDDIRNEIQFSSIELIPLETKLDLMLGSDIRLKFDSGDIFCLDNNNLHSIVRFDKSGNFLNTIGVRGNGPKEYPNITDFSVQGDSIVISSFQGDKGIFYFYSKEGIFLSKQNTDISPSSFEVLGNNFVLYVSYNKAFYNYRLYIVNKNKRNEFLPNNTKLDIPVIENNFYKSETALTFVEAFNNCAYTIEKDTLYKKFVFDFGRFSIPWEFYKMNSFEGLDMINKKGFANVHKYFESPDYSTFEILKQRQNEKAQKTNIILEKSSGSLFRSTLLNNKEMVVSDLVAVTNNNEFVFLIYPHDLLKNKTELEKLNITNKFIIEDINEMDNPILAFCKI